MWELSVHELNEWKVGRRQYWSWSNVMPKFVSRKSSTCLCLLGHTNNLTFALACPFALFMVVAYKSKWGKLSHGYKLIIVVHKSVKFSVRCWSSWVYVYLCGISMHGYMYEYNWRYRMCAHINVSVDVFIYLTVYLCV